MDRVRGSSRVNRDRRVLGAGLAAAVLGALPASAGVARPEVSLLEARPGETVRVLWLVEGIETPLFGYSLGVARLGADPDAVGNIAIDAAATNFFEPRNLITAGGGSLHPLFTVIAPDGSGGIFLSTNTADFSTVLPVAGVNDVLAELVFEVGLDALGVFEFGLGPISALSDGAGFPVGFDGGTLTILVVPTPWGLALLGLGLGAQRRR